MKREREDAARDIDELAADAIEGFLDEKKEHPGTLATIWAIVYLTEQRLGMYDDSLF